MLELEEEVICDICSLPVHRNANGKSKVPVFCESCRVTGRGLEEAKEEAYAQGWQIGYDQGREEVREEVNEEAEKELNEAKKEIRELTYKLKEIKELVG